MTTFEIQCRLGILGYLGIGEQDDNYGPRTKDAVARFQADYGLVPDGIAGTMTQKMLVGVIAGTVERAEKTPDMTGVAPESTDAERYLQSDGCYHIPRGVNVQLTENFWAVEIHCQGEGCCTESVISKSIMQRAQAVRDEIAEPLDIALAGGSGYRCKTRNADPTVRGAANSLHVTGHAVDLHHRNPHLLKQVILHHLDDGEVGLYSWGCHMGEWNRGYISQFNG